jgi:hypothetical protein
VRTGGLKSGPFTAGAINYYRITFAVKCFLEIHLWSIPCKQAVNKTLRSTAQIKIHKYSSALANEESDEAEAEFPDRLLLSFILCW